ncbi:MAG: DUF4404 family protein [Pseudomonadota bacterium]
MREQLARLHDELESTDAMDGEERGMLLQLMQDIHDALDRTSEPPPADSGDPADQLADRVSSAMARLEQEHPTVSFTLRRVVDLLGRMGI